MNLRNHNIRKETSSHQLVQDLRNDVTLQLNHESEVMIKEMAEVVQRGMESLQLYLLSKLRILEKESLGGKLSKSEYDFKTVEVPKFRSKFSSIEDLENQQGNDYEQFGPKLSGVKIEQVGGFSNGFDAWNESISDDEDPDYKRESKQGDMENFNVEVIDEKGVSMKSLSKPKKVSKSFKDTDSIDDNLDGPRKKQRQCPRCEYISNDKSNFKRHIKLHKTRDDKKEKGEEISSDEGDKTMDSSISDSIEVPKSPITDSLEGPRKKLRQCQRCEYRCNDKSNFRRHLNAHKTKDEKRALGIDYGKSAYRGIPFF